MASGSTKVIIISLCANMGIAISKFVGSMITGSAALLAEAVHSFSDCGNQALLLYGQHMGAKGPTQQYPLGRGKETFFWSFIVALLLFSVGGIFSFYEGLHKLHHPEELKSPIIGVIILLVAIALESYSFWACYVEVKKQKKGSMWQWIRTTTNADLLVIFLEDLAALLGLVFALAALSLAWITGNSMWDALGSMIIGVLLIVTAFVLAREVKSLLIGEAPMGDYEARIGELVKKHIPDGKLLRLIPLQKGIDTVMLAYKVHPGANPGDAAGLIAKMNALEVEVKQNFPEVKWQFAELDYND